MTAIPFKNNRQRLYLGASGPASQAVPGLLQTGREVVELNVTPVVDTSIYADGDVLFVAVEVTNVTTHKGGKVLIHDVIVYDADVEKKAFDLLILGETVAIGTINEAATLADADLSKVKGKVTFAAADYIDLGASAVAYKSNLDIVVSTKPDPTGSTSLWLAGVTRATPTFTAADDLRIRLVVERL